MSESDTRIEEIATEGSRSAVEYEYSDEIQPSTAVVQAICVLEDIDPTEVPTEVGFVLYDHINPGALDTILENDGREGTTSVSFEVSTEHIYSVEMYSDDRLLIRYDRIA
ncbi:HalOD1 output domain-containing protein [Natrinema sp. 1APR25-10V2]|uniref:HalOD1 output domain-containing protein n=1 Tax=Natrinema sp. 1APR25-10V2 TaxID=2951081 RepID=UPI0028765CBC|nr:HalOD1 output domain-containing protein [Natrinema sp. 1APR25-10V2]MDS0475454.1 hypothetical protein [Natrinema sp. 1APR25-10V2]